MFLQQGNQKVEDPNTEGDAWTPFIEDVVGRNDLVELDSWVQTLPQSEQGEMKRFPDNSSVVSMMAELSADKIQERLSRDSKQYDTDFIVDCGIPKHLIIPHGTREGELFYLYLFANKAKCLDCEEEEMRKHNSFGPWVHCGMKDTRYNEDKEERGFPFDRNILGCKDMKTCSMLDRLPNVYRKKITITHVGKKGES